MWKLVFAKAVGRLAKPDHVKNAQSKLAFGGLVFPKVDGGERGGRNSEAHGKAPRIRSP